MADVGKATLRHALDINEDGDIVGFMVMQELLRQIAFDEPKALRKRNRATPEELEIIVLKAMAKNPAERYGTAQELADDLRRFIDDLPHRARRPTLVQLAAKWSRRPTPVVAAAAVLLILATVGFAASTWLIAQEKSRTKDALGRSQVAERHAREAEDKEPCLRSKTTCPSTCGSRRPKRS